MRDEDFAAFYRAERPALTRFAATIVGPDRAGDVVADAVVSVMRRVLDDGPSGSPSSSTAVDDLRPYTYRAVANAGAREWRTIGRRARREALAASLGADRVAATTADDPGPAGGTLAEALARLSARQRAVVHLTYWEDLTPVDVAARLGISEGSVRRHLARARANLRRHLDGRSASAPSPTPQIGR